MSDPSLTLIGKPLTIIGEPSKKINNDTTSWSRTVKEGDSFPNGTGDHSWLGWCGGDRTKTFYTCSPNDGGGGYTCSSDTAKCDASWADGIRDPYLTCGHPYTATVTGEGAFCKLKSGEGGDLKVTCPSGSVPVKWSQYQDGGWNGFVCKKL